MKIAIVGTGGIGSTFALHLSRAGYDVTVIARGKRLEQLQRDQAIVCVGGVSVSGALDQTTPWNLVLVGPDSDAALAAVGVIERAAQAASLGPINFRTSATQSTSVRK